jgi:hypothetical protein
MSRITSAGFRVVNVLAIIPRCSQVWKFSAMDNDEVDRIKRPVFQAGNVGQVILMNDRFAQQEKPPSGIISVNLLAATSSNQ